MFKTDYIKDFDAWNMRQKNLEKRDINFEFSEREIWWCALGVNTGSELDGKNLMFERPVVILHKVNKDMCLVAPLTSTLKDHGDRVELFVAGTLSQVMLSQTRFVSSKRLLRKIHKCKMTIFQKIILELISLLLKYKREKRNPA